MSCDSCATLRAENLRLSHQKEFMMEWFFKLFAKLETVELKTSLILSKFEALDCSAQKSCVRNLNSAHLFQDEPNKTNISLPDGKVPQISRRKTRKTSRPEKIEVLAPSNTADEPLPVVTSAPLLLAPKVENFSATSAAISVEVTNNDEQQPNFDELFHAKQGETSSCVDNEITYTEECSRQVQLIEELMNPLIDSNLSHGASSSFAAIGLEFNNDNVSGAQLNDAHLIQQYAVLPEESSFAAKPLVKPRKKQPKKKQQGSMDDRPHKCELCDYRGKVKHDLVVHARTHTGEKPFKCDLCDYRSAQRTHIARHKRNIHSAERLFHCTLCGYNTEEKLLFVSHMQTLHPFA